MFVGSRCCWCGVVCWVVYEVEEFVVGIDDDDVVVFECILVGLQVCVELIELWIVVECVCGDCCGFCIVFVFDCLCGFVCVCEYGLLFVFGVGFDLFDVGCVLCVYLCCLVM